MTFFHYLFLTYNGIVSKIKYGIPFYSLNRDVCYINPLKKEKAIEIVFLKGSQLAQVSGSLEAKNRKIVAGITFTEIDEQRVEELLKLWETALELDKMIMPVKRKKF